MITASVSIGDEQKEILYRLTEAQLRKFLERQSNNLVAQARRNIKNAGTKASSKWEPLSKAYAKRKKEGKTPGHGRVKYGMLRDTEELIGALIGVVEIAPGMERVSLGLTAEGQTGDRPSNAELLVMHAEGAGNLPPRNPADDMRVFESRFEVDLQRFLEAKEKKTA
jgi:hypothetical protein